MYQVPEGFEHQTALPHDTGFVKAGGPSSDRMHLVLTSGSARDHLVEHTEIMQQTKPRHVVPITFFLTVVLGAVLINVLSIIDIDALPLRFTEWPHGLRTISFWAGGVAFLGLIVGTSAAMMRESRREEALSALAERSGVSQSIRTGLHAQYPNASAGKAREVAQELVGVTPEVRDRLIRLLREGKAEAAENAVRLLLDEAPRGSRPSRQDERVAAEADAFGALGR